MRKKAQEIWKKMAECDSKRQEIDVLAKALADIEKDALYSISNRNTAATDDVPCGTKPKNGTYRWQNHPLPGWMPLEAWKEWLTNRQKLKAVNSERALNSLIVKLDFCRTQGYSIEAVIDEAIMKGWKSIEADWLKTKPVRKSPAHVEYDACGNPL